MKQLHKQGSSLTQTDYQAILSALDDAVSVQDRNGRIIYQNPAYMQLLGVKSSSNPFTDDEEATTIDFDSQSAAVCMSGNIYSRERTLRISGKLHVFEIRTTPLRDESGHIYAAVESIRDISSHKQTEDQLTRYMNMYAALSHTNKAIMESSSRKVMFDRVCEAAVEFGKFSLSVIGLTDQDGTVRSVAHCGMASRYLDTLVVHSDAGREEGRGPTGKAIQEDKPYICNDFHNDPTTSPWRIAALKHGILSSAAFPLKVQGKVIGALKIYSDHAGYFDEEIVNLLGEMAANISFGLANFMHEDQRRNSQKALRYSEEQLKLVLEGSNDGFIDWHIPSSTVQMSARYLEMLGYTHDELLPKPATIKKLVHPDDWQRVEKLLNEELVRSHPAFETEARMLTKMGTWRWILYRGKVVEWDEHGMTTRVAGTCTDITEKKMYEEQLRYASTHDQLTGLYNRAYFDAEFARVKVGRNFPVSIVVADVDGLKLVNDHFGHAEGDRLIQMTAKALKESFRADDVVARIGGDEFAVILPNANIEAVKESIKRVLAFQQKLGKDLENGVLSISIGSATATSSKQLNDALKLADSQMYHYKSIRKSRMIQPSDQTSQQDSGHRSVSQTIAQHRVPNMKNHDHLQRRWFEESP